MHLPDWSPTLYLFGLCDLHTRCWESNPGPRAPSLSSEPQLWDLLCPGCYQAGVLTGRLHEVLRLLPRLYKGDFQIKVSQN